MLINNNVVMNNLLFMFAVANPSIADLAIKNRTSLSSLDSNKRILATGSTMVGPDEETKGTNKRQTAFAVHHGRTFVKGRAGVYADVSAFPGSFPFFLHGNAYNQEIL